MGRWLNPLKFHKGEQMMIKKPIFCPAMSIPAGSMIRIDSVDRLMRTYDVISIDSHGKPIPFGWITDVDEKDIVLSGEG